MPRKGIILAGCIGTRMYPLTVAVSKQLLPLYDKPMIYYPLSILMKAGIKDIIIISSKEHLPLFKKLLGTGSELGLNLTYKVQNKPQGIAQSILLAKDFLKKSDFCLVLGDNIIFGDEKEILNKNLKEWELDFEIKKSITSRDSFLLNIKNIKKKIRCKLFR